MAKKRLLCILIVLIALNGFCQPDKPFYKDKGHGWYNYEDPKPEPEKKDKDENIKPVIDWQAVQSMHPDRLNKLIEDVKDYALMFPSHENVKDYLKLQGVAIDRSREYMDSFMYVVQTNPELSKENEIPTSKFGQDEKHRIKVEKIEQTLAENRDKYALLYFYSPDCGYCAKQQPVLEYFIKDSGWQVKPINIQQDQKAALNFNIAQTPSIVLIRRNSPDWLLISSGIIALSELKERIVRGLGLI